MTEAADPLAPTQTWSHAALCSGVELARPLARPIVDVAIRLVDAGAIFLIGLVVYFAYVRSVWSPLHPGYLTALACGSLLTVLMLGWSGAYKDDALFSDRIPAGRILSGWAIAMSLLLALAFALKISDEFSRVWASVWFLGGAGMLLATHAVMQRNLRTLAGRGRFAARSIIVGAGEQGLRLAEHLKRHGAANCRLLGFVDDRQKRLPKTAMGLPVLGTTEDLRHLVRQELVDQIFIALPWSAEQRVLKLAGELGTLPVAIRLVPDLVGFQFVGRRYEHVGHLPVLNVYDRPISGWSTILKATEDRLLAATALSVFAPLMVAIAIAIKLDSRGPVLFRQRRLGFNSQLVEVWKFRTMHVDLTDQDCDIQTVRQDPRVTLVGRLLRRTSLDELPQLFNVLSGRMSLVGPRPHALRTKAEGKLFEDIVEHYAARHRVKPGITGWAQVNGWRGETDTVEKIRKRVEHDLYYIENWSLWLDAVILVRTLLVAWFDDNAF